MDREFERLDPFRGVTLFNRVAMLIDRRSEQGR